MIYNSSLLVSLHDDNDNEDDNDNDDEDGMCFV